MNPLVYQSTQQDCPGKKIKMEDSSCLSKKGHFTFSITPKEEASDWSLKVLDFLAGTWEWLYY